MDELEKKEELKKELEQEGAETEPAPETIEGAEEAPATEEPTGEEAAEEAPAAEEPAAEETVEKETAEPAIPAEKKKEEKSSSNIIGIIVGLAVFVAVLAYCWMLPGGGSVQDTGVFYAKDNDLYFYDLKNEPYLVQEGISEGGSYHYFYTAWGASVAEEGHWAYFSDNIDSTGAFDLYRKDTKNTAEAVLIDSNVFDFMASKNGEVVAYLKEKGEAMELCTFDGTEVRSIADGIRLENQVYALSGDGKYLAFWDAYGMLNAGIVADGSAAPLTDAAATYVLAEDSGTLYFVAKGTEGYNIYSYTFDGNEPVLVAENVSSMEMLPNGRDLLYCKASDELVLYSDIIVDDMAESDAALTEADGEAYEKKQQRDIIREAVANGEGFVPLLQECYVLTGGKSVLVAENVVSAVGVEHDRPYIVGYKAKEFTPLRLSVIDGGLDMVEYIYYMSLSYGGMETFLTDTAGNLE
ncbi:MAG: TolB family protein, partial [Anaerotignum sp.]